MRLYCSLLASWVKIAHVLSSDGHSSSADQANPHRILFVITPVYCNTVSHSTASAITRLIPRECHSIAGFSSDLHDLQVTYWDLSIMNECSYLCRSLKRGHPWWLNLCFCKLAVGLEYSARLELTDLEWDFWEKKIRSVSIDFHNFLFSK